MSVIRVRFAPSPTGELHIGGARTALFNYLFAMSNNGRFVLRIDDTDLERSKSYYCHNLMDALKWLGLDWNEGPYYQSKRIELYACEAERLLKDKKAYRCFCSIKDLEERRDQAKKAGNSYLYPGTCRDLPEEKIDTLIEQNAEHVIRLISPDSDETIVNDEIRGKVSFENEYLDDFIIIKSNGLPTYNFASIVDDLNLNITHIIRAEEHLTNTPLQILTAKALGFNVPKFVHAPMILAPDRSKLSKRHGATSVEEFRQKGMMPDTIINYIALLGWSPGGDREILSMKDMIDLFSINKISKTAAVYDINKMYWMNSQYLKTSCLDVIAVHAAPFYIEKDLIQHPMSEETKSYYVKVLELVRERAKTLNDLADNSIYFYRDDFDYDQEALEKALSKSDAPYLLEDAANSINDLKEYDAKSLETAFKKIIKEKETSAGNLVQPARLALTGLAVGPSIYEIMVLIGKKEATDRLYRMSAYLLQEKNRS